MFLQRKHKDLFTDVDSDAYLLLPKNLAAYNLYSASDFFAGILVFLPSVVASLMLEKDAERDWPASISRIMVLAQIAWLVIFITSWPQGWVRHLGKSRAQLLNYINLILLGTNLGSNVPEAVLNRQVFAVNLLLARKLQHYEKLALVLWAAAIAAGVAIMQWEANSSGSILSLNLVVRDANVVMFAFWQGLKLLILVSVVLQKEAAFSFDSGGSSGCVTDANLSYYVKLFCTQPDGVFQSVNRQKGPHSIGKSCCIDSLKEESVKIEDLALLEAKDFDSTGSTLEDSPKFNISTLDQTPHGNQEITVSMVPFPFGSSTKESSKGREVPSDIPSSKVSTQEKIKRFNVRGLLQASPVAVSPPATEAFASPYNSRLSLHESSIPRSSGNFSARAFTAKKHARKFARRNVEHSFSPRERFLGHTTVTFQHDPLVPVFLEEAKNEILEDVNKKVEEEKNKFFSTCWNLWTNLLYFDIHKGYPGVFYHNIFLPWKSFSKMAIAVFINIPLNMAWVILCLLLFIPRVFLKIFVVAPVVIIRDYRENSNSTTYQKYRETHKVPLFTESATATVANMLLRRITGSESKEYADTVHTRKS